MPFPAPTEFDIIASCLRLSHKYGVEYLRRRALIHLSSGYRTTLSEYDACRYHGLDSFPSLSVHELRSWPLPANGYRPGSYLIATIQLAREVDAPWILPCVFYSLCTYNELARDIFLGVVHNGVPVSLSEGDQQLFVQSQNTSATAEILRFLFHPLDIAGCTSPRQCFSARLQAMESNHAAHRDNPSIPLDIWEPNDWRLLKDLCLVCLTVLKKTHEDAREAFWARLPEIYGLPEWEELERLKSAAIGTNLFC
ncbi:hypothetical protein B0H19DRAFT_1374365 [Mycena capillaripes]|nr:hypothetical protein B0H19DRAFT_1374365 [Mycena capillaripes]